MHVPVGTIVARHYTDPGKAVEFHMQKKVLASFDIKGKIVLVDDVVGTGTTMSEVLKLLKRNKNITKIMTGALYYNEKSTFKPDMYVKEMKQEQWIVFPYEKEAYQGLEL